MRSWKKRLSMTIGSAIIVFSVLGSTHAMDVIKMEDFKDDVELYEYFHDSHALFLKQKINQHALSDVLLKYYFSAPADGTIQQALEGAQLDHVRDVEFDHLTDIANIFLNVCKTNSAKNEEPIKKITEFRSKLKGKINRNVMRRSTLTVYSQYVQCKLNNNKEQSNQSEYRDFKDNVSKKDKDLDLGMKNKVKKSLKIHEPEQRINIAERAIDELKGNLSKLLQEVPKLEEKQLILLITEIENINTQLTAMNEAIAANNK